MQCAIVSSINTHKFFVKSKYAFIRNQHEGRNIRCDYLKNQELTGGGVKKKQKGNISIRLYRYKARTEEVYTGIRLRPMQCIKNAGKRGTSFIHGNISNYSLL